MKKAALIVDHPSRDLDYIVDIATNLNNLKIKTFIVPSNLRHRELLLLSPDYVLYPNHRDYFAEEVNILKKSRILVGVLETEQCVHEDFFQDYQLTKDKEKRKDIEDFFVWGEYFSNTSIKRNWYNENQIKIIGSPKHDRYLKKIKKKDKDFDILVATSFPNSSPIFGEKVNTNSYKDLGMKDEHIKTFIELHKENRQNTISFINKYLSGKKYKVLLRVHPYEKKDMYINEIKGENIAIDDSDETIFHSLNKSKILLHYNSSSCVDAQVAKIPSINMSWMRTMKVFHESTEIMKEISYQPKSEIESIELIDEILENKISLKTENDNNAIEKFIYNLDGNSSARCAEIIRQTVDTKKVKKEIFKNQTIFLTNFSIKGFFVSLFLKYKWMKTKKYFNRKDINNSLDKIGTSLETTNPKINGISLSSVEIM